MAAVYPAVMAATAIYGAYQAHKQGQQQKNALNEQRDLAQQTIPYGQQFMGMANNALGPSLNYYSSLLGGNRSAMQETMAPELNDIARTYSGMTNSIRTLYPRGGMTPSASTDVRNRMAGDINNTMFRARPMAASALGGLGTNLASLGLQSYGMGSSNLNNYFQNSLANNQQQYQQGAGLGNAFFNAYQQYLMSRATQQPNDSYTGTFGTGSYNPSYDTWQGFYPGVGQT